MTLEELPHLAGSPARPFRCGELVLRRKPLRFGVYAHLHFSSLLAFPSVEVLTAFFATAFAKSS